jgi:hypothetical protein
MARGNLDSVVSVRFTDEEVEQLRRRADEIGESVSGYIRRAALGRLSPVRDSSMWITRTGSHTSAASASEIRLGSESISSLGPKLIPMS